MKGNARTRDAGDNGVAQLQEVNAAILKAFAPILGDLTKAQLQERIIGNKKLSNEIADGLGVWRVLHGRCTWETLVSRANVAVDEADVPTLSKILRETDDDVTGWWPISVPRVAPIGRFTARDDVVAAIRKRYDRDRSCSARASTLQLFAYAARHLLLDEEVTVVTLDPELQGPIPAFTYRKSGPLEGRRIRLCWTDLDLLGGGEVYVAFDDALDTYELTPGGLSERC